MIMRALPWMVALVALAVAGALAMRPVQLELVIDVKKPCRVWVQRCEVRRVA
jgi:hypothetical protein